MDRREFLRSAAAVTAAWSVSRKTSNGLGAMVAAPDLVVVRDGSPAALVRRAVNELGGMVRFVKRNDVVVLKPNMSWDRVPEQGATTNPEIVGEVVRMCLEVGAKKVKVFDNTLNEPKRCYSRTGIENAARAAGADVSFVSERRFKTVSIPEGELITSWSLSLDALDADCLINIPAAKHHSISSVSLGMKNLMGLIGGNRGLFHRQFDVKITDLNSRLRPSLTLLDAYRVLFRNGPSGGSLSDVEIKKTVVAGVDPIAVDSFGATLFGLNPKRLSFLTLANERGLGEIDLAKLSVKNLSIPM